MNALPPILTLPQLSHYVEMRLTMSLPSDKAPTVLLAVVAQYVAGVLLTLFQWWLNLDMTESPEQIDEYFLELVRPGIRAATGVEIKSLFG